LSARTIAGKTRRASRPAERLPCEILPLVGSATPAYGRRANRAHDEQAMADHLIPHFHNQPGVPKIRIRVKEFMCVGALPPFDHPHIFIDMGEETEAVCSYCSTLFAYDPMLAGICDPPACEFSPLEVEKVT
jgi:uncharacterized Zn-finger protein